MATTGLLDPIPLTNAGDKGVVISGAMWDLIVSRINLACAPSLNPTSDIGSFYVSKGGIILDLSLLDQRLSNVEARLDGASANGICNGSNIEITFVL